MQSVKKFVRFAAALVLVFSMVATSVQAVSPRTPTHIMDEAFFSFVIANDDKTNPDERYASVYSLSVMEYDLRGNLLSRREDVKFFAQIRRDDLWAWVSTPVPPEKARFDIFARGRSGGFIADPSYMGTAILKQIDLGPDTPVQICLASGTPSDCWLGTLGDLTRNTSAEASVQRFSLGTDSYPAATGTSPQFGGGEVKLLSDMRLTGPVSGKVSVFDKVVPGPGGTILSAGWMYGRRIELRVTGKTLFTPFSLPCLMNVSCWGVGVAGVTSDPESGPLAVFGPAMPRDMREVAEKGLAAIADDLAAEGSASFSEDVRAIRERLRILPRE